MVANPVLNLSFLIADDAQVMDRGEFELRRTAVVAIIAPTQCDVFLT